MMGVPGGSDGKESACNVGDLGSIPRLGRSPGEGKGYPLQSSGLDNSMDSIVHGGCKSQTQLSMHTVALRKPLHQTETGYMSFYQSRMLKLPHNCTPLTS